MFECVFINAKRLKSKAGKDFNLATFVLNGEPFKLLINDKVFSQVQNLSSGCKVNCFYDLSIWSEDLKVTLSSVELAS